LGAGQPLTPCPDHGPRLLTGRSCGWRCWLRLPGFLPRGRCCRDHLAAAYDFLQCVAEGTPSAVDFEAGLSVQEILEAAYLSAARGGERIALPL
jgi:predicted dehydrogenase